MNMPDSTINSAEQASFDEKKAYVEDEKGKAFVPLPVLLPGIAR